VGITIPRARLEEVLERAVALAESDAELPQIWIDRVRRIGDCPNKTYIAALGTALLAKASNSEIDALTIKAQAGQNAYSMRTVVQALVTKAPTYGYHLGVLKREPLNNQPWFHNDRVDEIENVRSSARPFHRDMVRFLTELNASDEDGALFGLAAFLRERIAISEAERAAAERIVVAPVGDIRELVEVVERLLREDSEGGRRAQALVAAVFDLSHDEVNLASVNDPTGIDVSLTEGGRVVLAVEVKHKQVDESDVLEVAARAAALKCDKALMVALEPAQRPLDRERVRRQAHQSHGVFVVTWIGVTELIESVGVQVPLSAMEIAAELPETYARRLQEHGVSLEGQQYWADLVAALAAREQAG
jgi:hypothetical protein